MPDQPLNPPVPDNPTPEIIDPPKQMAKGRRGGQPGNTNALRHGFYAKNLGNFSPRKYDEPELRNLLGEAAMLKDYMYFLYNSNLGTTDSTALAETLRALALAGMALSRLLQVHSSIRIMPSSGKKLSSYLDSLEL